MGKRVRTTKPKPSRDRKQFVLTKAQINQMVDKTSKSLLSIFIATCMDEFDWTDDDLERFAERLDRYYKARTDSHDISTDKINKIVEQVMGTKIL